MKSSTAWLKQLFFSGAGDPLLLPASCLSPRSRPFRQKDSHPWGCAALHEACATALLSSGGSTHGCAESPALGLCSCGTRVPQAKPKYARRLESRRGKTTTRVAGPWDLLRVPTLQTLRVNKMAGSREAFLPTPLV